MAGKELHLYTVGKLSEWICYVVKTESPVHFEEVARRMDDANGISKIGNRIRTSLINAIDYATDNNLLIKKRRFFIGY
ncbi:DUF3320 domain-containing protein [Chryseobacterium sp. S90]|uniref:DUF3320 domain-containing protein n=1 Tax=Chryseobacterium sp. S90 TaxID=3395373 RepID=UPI0039BD4476